MFVPLLYIPSIGSFGVGCGNPDTRDHLDMAQLGYGTCTLCILSELGRVMQRVQLDMEKRMGDFWSSVQCASTQIYQSSAFDGYWALISLTMWYLFLICCYCPFFTCPSGAMWGREIGKVMTASLSEVHNIKYHLELPYQLLLFLLVRYQVTYGRSQE